MRLAVTAPDAMGKPQMPDATASAIAIATRICTGWKTPRNRTGSGDGAA